MQDTSMRSYNKRGIGRTKALLVFLILNLVCIALDQLSKIWARNDLSALALGKEFIPGVLRFLYVENRGAAFGILSGAHIFFVIMACGVCLVALMYLCIKRRHMRLSVVSLSLICAGAVGNLIDRLLYGYVTDFLCTEFISFPVFNIADICVTCGSALLIAAIILEERALSEN